MKKLSFYVLLLALSSTQSFATNRPAKKAAKVTKPAVVRTTTTAAKGAFKGLPTDNVADNTPTPTEKKASILPNAVRPSLLPPTEKNATPAVSTDKKNLLLKNNTNPTGVNLLETKPATIAPLGGMPTYIPFIGKDGKPALGKDGKPVMVVAGKDGKPLLDKAGNPTLAPLATTTSQTVTMPATLTSLGTKLLSSLNFCGEKVSLDNQAVVDKLDQTFQRYVGLRGAMSHYARLGGRYKNEFVRALQKQGVPAEMYYLSIAESGLANRTSSQGAAGFWQFMPESAPMYGLEVSETVDERWHPQKAATAAATYLKWLHRKFGSWALAAGAYNMGEGAMANVIAAQGTRNYFNLQLNPETGQYVYNILTIKYMMDNPGMFGISTSGKYAPIPYQKEMVNYDIQDLAAFAQDCDTDYESLKILNPWLISDHLNVQPGKRYEIRLPLNPTQKIVADELIAVPFSITKTVKELRDSIVQFFSTKGGKYETLPDSTEEDINWDWHK
ncbi:MAG: lytic transglycosylase domain-containing protein [Bacteroidia bacterium]